jgi:hypothetical protein
MSSYLLEPYGRESSIDSDDTFVQDRADYEAEYATKSTSYNNRPFWLTSIRALFFLPLLLISRSPLSRKGRAQISGKRTRLRGGFNRRVSFLGRILLCIVFGLIVIFGTFRPSYKHTPLHYDVLRALISESQEKGRGNPLKEQIFISCALYDKNGHLAGGSWGQTLLDFINILGPENVFLSIYENDSGDAGATALLELKSKVKCDHEVVSELHVPADPFPTVVLPDGAKRHKRIPYLADMRNRALRPLDMDSNRKYDKVLILNDVFFNPIEAAQLLFSTHVGQDGKADYLAACAVDFINPFKFYDTYATRDLDGYSMGVPFFPWFSSAGRGRSRQDVLDQKDAVRVKSCWGGMVAFDAPYLQSFSPVMQEGFQEIDHHTIPPDQPRNVSAPVRFRAEPEIFFDACECCLILADVIRIANTPNVDDDSRVYLNPFVRVAYDPTTLSWLGFTRRFERLYSLPHWLVTVLARLPTYNPHRAVEQGEKFQEEVWRSDSAQPGGGSWQIEDRTARNGLYCGVREMQVLLEKQRTDDKNWANTPIPSGGRLW